MKSTKDMSVAELVLESQRLNERIATDSSQSARERKLAQYKLGAPKRMKKGYMEAMKSLYGD